MKIKEFKNEVARALVEAAIFISINKLNDNYIQS